MKTLKILNFTYLGMIVLYFALVFIRGVFVNDLGGAVLVSIISLYLAGGIPFFIQGAFFFGFFIGTKKNQYIYFLIIAVVLGISVYIFKALNPNFIPPL